MEGSSGGGGDDDAMGMPYAYVDDGLDVLDHLGMYDGFNSAGPSEDEGASDSGLSSLGDYGSCILGAGARHSLQWAVDEGGESVVG